MLNAPFLLIPFLRMLVTGGETDATSKDQSDGDGADSKIHFYPATFL